MLLGAYHYAKFATVAEAKAEAAYFLNSISFFCLNYPAVLYLKENKKSASKKTLTDAAIAFWKLLKMQDTQLCYIQANPFLKII
ncbi:GH25 family lysozyme [Peribacillus simplex]